jgi:hypothetical protein
MLLMKVRIDEGTVYLSAGEISIAVLLGAGREHNLYGDGLAGIRPIL